jgi:pilus assembly protein CpaE
MSKEPFGPLPAADKSATPSLADLLAARAHEADAPPAPAEIRRSEPASVRPESMQPLQPRTARILAEPRLETASPAETVKVPLLLVHAEFSEGALIQTWMQHVMKGPALHLARFQEGVTDLVLDHQPYAVLIQFDPCCIDAAVTLSAQLQTQYPQIPRLAVGRARHAQCMLAALRTGVQDFLDIDGSVETAQLVVRKLLSSPPSAGLHVSRAPQTAIVAARGGMGCSLLAAHLSWHLQLRLGGPTSSAAAPAPDKAAAVPDSAKESLANLLIELGTPGGDCAIYLNTPGEFGFTDAVNQQRRLDRRMAQSALARHASGLRLLTLSRQGHALPSEEVQALLNRLGHYFRHIVLDMGATESPQMLKDVLPAASEIWVVCDQSVASVVWTAELLLQLDGLQIPRNRRHLIVSRHDSGLELSAEQIARQLQLPLLAQLPERRRELAQVVNQGALFTPQQKREPYVQVVEKLVDRLLADHHPDMAPPPASANPLNRLLHRIGKH